MASKIKVDQIQTADGSGTIALQNQLSGMTGASMPTGSVLQVVSDTNQTELVLSSANTWVDTGLSLTITPSTTSSKIHLQYTFPNIYFQFSGGGVAFRILRGSTSLFTPSILYEHYSSQTGMHMGYANIALDSPSTTSAITYKVQAAQYESAVVQINDASGTRDTLIAMEIAG